MMKKLIVFVTVLVTLTCGNPLKAQAASEGGLGQVNLLVKEYSLMPDVQVISLGRLGLSFVKTILAHEADRDTRAVLSMIRNVRKVTIMDYSDSSLETKRHLASRLSKALKNNELLLQAKDGGESLEIYGTTSDDGETVDNLVLNAPGSGALVCIKGTIRTKDIARIIESER